jgi:polar amino acid transport system substrate-binding protein
MKLFQLKKKFALCLSLVMLLGSMTACQASSNGASTSTSASNISAQTSSAASGESALLQEIKKKGYITIGSSNDAPFFYKDVSTGKLAGVDVDILRAVCSKLGIADVQMKVIDFSNLLVELNNNNVDMVADAMYVKDARLKVAAFSDKWYQEGEAIVIPQSSAIKSKDDLKGKAVGAQPGTTFYETAQKWQKDGAIGSLVSYDSQATLMTAVNMGKVDAVVTDGIVAGYTLSKDSTLKLKLLSPYKAEASGQIGSAVRFKDEAFLTEFNTVLNDMKKDGSLLKILKDYGLTEDYFVGVDEGKTKNVK